MSEVAARVLDGKVAIVTGSSRGIGLQTTQVLAAAGARVVLADLPSAPLEESAAAASQAGEVVAHPVDLTDEASIAELVAFTVKTFGRLDILNNNAALTGTAEDLDVVTMSADTWDRTFMVNARGTMLMCKHAIPAMIESGGGSIVNISSGTAHAGQAVTTAYACSKGAIETLTKYVATQYGAQGIRCNAVAPGLIATEALKENMPQPLVDAVVAEKLVGRVGDPRDISKAVLWLASEDSSFITGEILRVDGGFYAHAPMMNSVARVVAELQGARLGADAR